MKKATEKQRALAKAIIENVKTLKGKPLGILMKEVGYSVAQSKNPAQIVRSNSFQTLMAKSGVSQSELAESWKTLLRAEVESKPQSWRDKISIAKEMSKLFGFAPEDETLSGPKARFFSRVATLEMTPEEEKEARRREEEAENYIEDGSFKEKAEEKQEGE